MKKKKLITALSVILITGATLLVSQKEVKAQRGSTMTTVTDIFETNYCRCHGDGQCYNGNLVSFRRRCGSFSKDVNYSCSANVGC